MNVDFVVAGGMRCATGWIRECLKEHPDIFIAQKEPHFFDRNYEKGLDWYSSFFVDYKNEELIGEKTASYFHDLIVPDRIKSNFPNCKIIICLRDPLERMFSHYSMLAEEDQSLRQKGFLDSVQSDIDYVKRSLYYESVSKFIECFSVNDVLITIYEDKDKDPVKFIQNIYIFVGVDPTFKAPSALVRTKLGQFEHNNWFWGRVGKIMLHPRTPFMFKSMYSAIRPSYTETGITEKEYSILSKYFIDDIIKLEEILGRDLNCWKTKKFAIL